jgi:hypothetical protein
MKFPILLKKGKIFVRYGGRWINIPLSTQAHGGGLKGYYRFFKGWILCILSKHTYGHVFSMRDMKTYIRCQYCRKEKHD